MVGHATAAAAAGSVAGRGEGGEFVCVWGGGGVGSTLGQLVQNDT